MIHELNVKERRRALKIFKEQLEREARDAKELRENEIFFDGKQEANLATATRLKAMGSTDEFIAKATGLSLELIKEL